MVSRLNVVLYGGPMDGQDHRISLVDYDKGTIVVKVRVKGQKELHRYTLQRGHLDIPNIYTKLRVSSWRWDGKVEGSV